MSDLFHDITPLEVYRALEGTFGSYLLIAGGYARDTHYGKTPKDCDILMAWPDAVPRAADNDATEEEMAELATWAVKAGAQCDLRSNGEGVEVWFGRVCPNYHEVNALEGSFDDRIACVIKMRLVKSMSVLDVDILIPRHAGGPLAYVKEFDYNINQFIITRTQDMDDTVCVYIGEDDLLQTGKVREIGRYGRFVRAKHMHYKYPELDWTECTFSDKGGVAGVMEEFRRIDCRFPPVIKAITGEAR